MSSYLLSRNGNYHVRIRIPSDLTKIICATELVKSLKTRDIKTAKVAALPYRQNISKTFSLLRSGFITGEQARESINRTLHRKIEATPRPLPFLAREPDCGPSPALSLPLPTPKQALLLSAVVDQYLDDRKNG